MTRQKRNTAPPRRLVAATVQDTLTPPDTLLPTQCIARITKAEGKNLYTAELPGGKSILTELGAKFRSTVWMKRGSFVVVDTAALADRENKLDGEIVNVVRNEKEWRKTGFWPPEFVKASTYLANSDEEESVIGKLPPTDSDEE